MSTALTPAETEAVEWIRAAIRIEQHDRVLLLLSALDRLAKDAERLDWMEKWVRKIKRENSDTRCWALTIRREHSSALPAQSTLRAAVDAARSGQEKK